METPEESDAVTLTSNQPRSGRRKISYVLLWLGALIIGSLLTWLRLKFGDIENDPGLENLLLTLAAYFGTALALGAIFYPAEPISKRHPRLAWLYLVGAIVAVFVWMKLLGII